MKLQPWQEELMRSLQIYGNVGALSTGRQLGKSFVMQSYINQWESVFKNMPNFEKLDSAIVDGDQWYTVECSKEVSDWIRGQSKDQWYEHKQQARHQRGIFDMPESLFIIMSMKWA